MKIWLIVAVQIFAFSAIALDEPPGADASSIPAGANALVNAAVTPIPPITVGSLGPGVEALISKANQSITSCNSQAETAHTWCLANKNEKIHTGMLAINALLGAQDAIQSANDGCQVMNKAMAIAKTALTAYTASCAAMQTPCNLMCGSAETDINAVLAANKAATPHSNPALEAAAQKSLAVAVHSAKQCAGYKYALASAGIGLFGVIRQSAASKKCDKNTTVADCGKNPSDPSCMKAIDCSVAANQSDVQCICQRSPNSPGCPGYNGLAGAAPVGRGVGGTTDASGAGTPALGAVSGADTVSPTGGAAKMTADGTGAGGSGAGGAGGGGGGGFGSGNPTAGKGGADGKSDKILNPNILTGYDGGGGGGGGGSRSYGGGQPDSPYGAYMPGGSKDPVRGIASKTFANGEVTGAGAKSNWEKVRDRYVDNKPTLLGK